MLLTLYYMAATWVQAWRLGSLKTRLSKYISSNYSVVLYKMPENVLVEQDITGPCLVTSLNMSTSHVFEVLQLDGPLRMCTLFPSQNLILSNWVAAYGNNILDNAEEVQVTNGSTTANDSTVKLDDLKLLLEAQVKDVNREEFEWLDLQRYGSLIAWHFDNTLDLVLTSSLQQLTELTQKFLKGSAMVNGGMELLRIETINTHGSPVVIDSDDRTIQYVSRNLLASDNLLLHVTALKELSNNASEIGNRVKLKSEPTELINELSPARLGINERQESSNTVQSNPASDQSGQMKANKQIDNKVEKIKTDTKATIVEDVHKNGPETSTSRNMSNGEAKPAENSSNNIDLEKKRIKEEEITVKNVLKTMSSPKSVSFKKRNEENLPKAANNTLVKTKKFTGKSKPPNILVFSESVVAIDNVKSALRTILHKDKYTIYTLTKAQVQTDTWMDNASLVIACGSVTSDVAPRLLNYLLRGGKLLCLCSDLIHTVLPTYKTAEVREHELVRFSYGRWQNVRMMHHIFCYQASPARKHFSHDSMDENQPLYQNSVQPTAPSSIEVRDTCGRTHKLKVEVLGAEETWHTPSILLATTTDAQPGRAAFSQVHLEVDPTQYESEEAKYAILKDSNEARLEILRDILGKHLGLLCSPGKADQNTLAYTPAYFLGRHELKLALLQFLKPNMTEGNILKTSRLSLKFCGKGETAPQASENVLPVMVHSCPENFSTVEYFENLKSEEVGRLVLYSSVLTSSQDILAGVRLQHGVVVVPRLQTQGTGRSANQWLSPEGCAMFSVQLHLLLDSPLGQRTPLVQHLVATAVVTAVLGQPGYENLDIGLKWPNDIYANGTTKIGGLVVTSTVESDTTICNIGCGVNLNNGDPTTCLNDIITQYNSENGAQLKTLSQEKFLALVFTEIEDIFERVQKRNDLEYFYELYYKHWLHSNANILVMDESSGSVNATVHGIDDYGFLLVRYPNKKLVSVHPDGNSFDMLKGLIVPKMF